ncbi:MAG: tRNA glutamyl-Q(34) synthetase GluQRS [Hyphomicrobiaceae bacterium]
MSAPGPVLRFAPSPNGELHLGHALSALVDFRMAQRLGGTFLVRIEDIDVERCRPEFVAGILEDLDWLGIRWQEPVERQSQHFPDYQAAAQRLDEQGLLFPCFATRSEIERSANPDARDPDGALLYPGIHRGLSATEIAERKARKEPFALRIDMRRAVERAREILNGAPLSFVELTDNGRTERMLARPERWGDAVLVRKDVPASYHLSVVVDDARQRVTHVTRGLDLLPSTDIHRLLQVLLGLPEPLYHHHRLITDATGRKLAKSAHDTSLAALRARGATPADIRRMVGLD